MPQAFMWPTATGKPGTACPTDAECVHSKIGGAGRADVGIRPYGHRMGAFEDWGCGAVAFMWPTATGKPGTACPTDTEYVHSKIEGAGRAAKRRPYGF